MRWLTATQMARRGRRVLGRLRGTGIASVTALLIPLAGVAPAAGATVGAHGMLPVPAQKLVPVHAVPSHPVKIPPDRPWSLPRTAWPAAGTASVTVPAAGSVRAGSMPLWVGTSSAWPRTAVTARGDRVRVVMTARAAAARAGVSGVIFTMAQSGSRAARRVQVRLDYSSFAYADGGDYAARLRLVELPACALTTPAVPACRRQTPLTSADNVKRETLSSDVTLPSAAGQPVVLAATTAASGSAGDYTATPLSEAGTWTAGNEAGAFTYSYPVQVPPVPGGLEPSVSLDYSSQSVDGLTSVTNNQASFIGDGWDYDPGYIERDYQSCEQNPAGPSKTGDECWSANDTVTLSLGGMSTALVDDPVTGWHAETANGYQVQYVAGTGTSCTAYDGGYWVVTAPNGTSYYFGRNELPGYVSGKTATGSVFTMPVYATKSGQPCYNATFADAHSVQAWRWNLDWVTDPHGNAVAYYYQHETNYYAAGNATTATEGYTQGGVVSSIQYGLESADGYGTPAAEVMFTSAEDRTDVPTGSSQDLACASGATCDVTSPTFWDKYELTTIATSTREGTAQAAVDSWALAHEYLSAGSGSAAPLWLESITRTGEDGTAVPLPPVSFTPTSMDNRTDTAANLTDGYSMVPRNRIATVTTETGGIISVKYYAAPASCTSGTFPADDANTLWCYPVYWTPQDSGMREDWFNKYAVESVTEENTAGGITDVVTSYSYSGAAWHYDDDALSRSEQRTWDQWRGFQKVTTETGVAADGDPVTETTDTYFQGMNGDYQDGNATTSASLTSTVGDVTVADSPQFAGTEFEHTVYDGAGGAIVTDTVTTPWTSAAEAVQSQPTPLPVLTAYLTGTAKMQTFTELASGGYREADVTYAHDSYGRVTSESNVPDASDNGTGGDPADDTCTQTTYNASPAYNGSPSAWKISLPAEVTVTSVAPSSCPVSGTPAPADLVSDTKYFYDGATSITAAATAGDITETGKATSYSGTTEVFTPESEDTYDEYGRVLKAYSADAIALGTAGQPTVTAYTPATGAEPASVTVTDPMGLVTTTTYDPARDLPLTATNPAGWVTTETYDALGRLTAVWTPGHDTGGPADETFTYSLPKPGTADPTVITTGTINAAGTDQTSETIYDSLGRQVETQDETADGNRDVTDTYYNTDGWRVITDNSYPAKGAPSPKLVAANDNQVPSETAYVYDGDGRVTRQIADSFAAEQYETDTSYGGDYTTVTPRAGGTATTTYVNGIGKTSYIYQYHAATPPGTPPAPGTATLAGSSGWDETAYTYTPAGQLKTITDPTGDNNWTYGYDLLGDQTSASDPDSGDTTRTYDGNGNQLSVTNTGTKTTLSYTYDQDNRKTVEYDTTGGATETGSDELAAWTYDTLAKGQPTSSTSYAGGTSGTSYTEAVTGYNAYGLPQGTETRISAGPWAGTYQELYGYTADANQLNGVTYQGAGGLPQEGVTIGYDAADDPVSLGGLDTYVAALIYTELAQPQEYELGTTDTPAWIFETYDQATSRLTSSEVQTGLSPVTVDDINYTYDNDGLITSEADTPSSGPTQIQCFTYDYLQRLTAAWSQGTTGCGTSGPASQSAETTAAAPYYDQYQYDTESNLTSVTSTPASGSAATTTGTFPAAGSTAAQPAGSATAPAPPHAVSATGPAGGTATTTYSYDEAGQLTKVTTTTSSQAFSWNDAGQLGSVTTTGGADAGTTSYAYDAAGNLLQQTDSAAGTSTLYLPDEILTKTISGTVTYDSTRYYSIGGVTIAARTSGGAVDYLAGNQQGTSTVAIDSSTLAATYRYYDPYGNPLGAAAAATWPGTRGFVGGTTDTATGLTDLGAREYTPGTGEFISPDALIKPYQPQDLNAYAYSQDDPATGSDPTGLNTGMPDGGGGCSNPSACNPPTSSGNGNTSNGSSSGSSSDPTSNDWIPARGRGGGCPPRVCGNQDSGNPIDFITGFFDSVVTSVSGSTCFTMGTAACGNAAASGNLPAQRYDRLLASHGIDTSSNAYTGGKFLSFIASIAITGVGAAGDAAAVAEEADVLAGSGPARGILEVSSRVKSTAAFENFNPAVPRDFVFDPVSERLLVGGRDLPKVFGHSGLVGVGGFDEGTVVGGQLTRGSGGEFLTNEWSGHFGENWTDAVRQQFSDFMSGFGFDTTHAPWGGG